MTDLVLAQQEGRLGVKRAPVIVESAKRRAIHEANKCTVHRIEVAK